MFSQGPNITLAKHQMRIKMDLSKSNLPLASNYKKLCIMLQFNLNCKNDVTDVKESLHLSILKHCTEII